MSSNIRVKRICKHCGNEFIAKTTVTKYCTDICAKSAYKVRMKENKIKKSNQETEKTRLFPLEQINSKAFLSIAETAQLLGVSRTTIYRMIRRNYWRCARIGRRIIIRRLDIEKLFEGDEIIPKKKKYKINQCMTISEAQDRFNISESGLRLIIQRHQIPKTQTVWI
jgi:excisionase family DNA binding protein